MSEPRVVFTDDFRAEMGRVCAALRHDGWKLREIADHTGLTISTVHALAYYSDWTPPQWPRTVTRIAPGGRWWIVRESEQP